MDVTKQNFDEIFPVLERAILEADFIAIDTEFSGLEGVEKGSLFDSPSDRYRKYKSTVEHFTLCQLGISCFRRDPLAKKFIATVFNVYTVPVSFGSQISAFSCSRDAMKFLAKHDFDFNKWMKSGVGFMNREQLAKLEEEIRSGLFPMRSFEDEDEEFRGAGKESSSTSTTPPENNGGGACGGV